MKNGVTSLYMRIRTRAEMSIAEVFGAGVSFLKKRFKTHRDEESPVTHRSDGAAFSLDEEQLETLLAVVEVCPNATLEELQSFIADECKVTVSQMSIHQALKILNLPLVRRGENFDHSNSPGQEEASL
jgi:transposase